MTMLIKIGNSQGVRIPKAIIKQAHLENTSLEFEVTAGGLLLKPIQKKPREGWAEVPGRHAGARRERHTCRCVAVSQVRRESRHGDGAANRPSRPGRPGDQARAPG